MSTYTYDIKREHFDPTTGVFTEVGIDTAEKYGWFEQYKMCPDQDIYMHEGGLWFDYAPGSMPELIDQDGPPSLPKTVAWILRDMGVIVDKDFE